MEGKLGKNSGNKVGLIYQIKDRREGENQARGKNRRENTAQDKGQKTRQNPEKTLNTHTMKLK